MTSNDELVIDCSKCGERCEPYPHPRSQVCQGCFAENVVAYRARVDQVVAEHRFMIQGVMASDDQYEWAYTVGLTAHGLPELVMSTLPVEFMGNLLTLMGNGALDGELELVEGPMPREETDGLGAEQGWWLIEVPDPGTPVPGPLSIAYQHAAGREVRALQVVWPDSDGNWPWSPGWGQAEGWEEDEWRQAQPLWGPAPRLCAACGRSVGDLWVAHTQHEEGCSGEGCACPEVCWQCCGNCSS